jgi:hypothetical protein
MRLVRHVIADGFGHEFTPELDVGRRGADPHTAAPTRAGDSGSVATASVGACGPRDSSAPFVGSRRDPTQGASPPAIALREVASGLSAAIGHRQRARRFRRLFVVQQGGLIRILRPDGTMPETSFLDLSDRPRAAVNAGLLAWPSTRLPLQRPALRELHTDTSGNTDRRGIRGSETDADRADPPRSRACSTSTSPTRTTTAATWSSVPTDSSTWHG